MHSMLASLCVHFKTCVPEDVLVLPLRTQRRCSPGTCLLISETWPCRVNGQPLREGGYEVHAAFGPFRSHECAVDAVAGLAAIAVGAVTEITVVPREGAEAGRIFSGTEVVQAHVTGEAALAGLATLCTLYAKTCTCKCRACWSGNPVHPVCEDMYMHMSCCCVPQ